MLPGILASMAYLGMPLAQVMVIMVNMTIIIHNHYDQHDNHHDNHDQRCHDHDQGVLCWSLLGHLLLPCSAWKGFLGARARS